MTIARYLLPFAMLAPPAGVQAQHPLVLEKLDQWDSATPQPDMAVPRERVLAAAEQSYASVDGCDPSALSIDRVQSPTADRFAFNGLARGTMRNAWFVETRLPGCDAEPVRFMVLQQADESFQTIRTNRGETLAWVSLIGDSMPLARTAAYGALKRAGQACELDSPARLGALRIVARADDLGQDVYGVRYAGSWSEVWPITMCDRTVEVHVDFTADGDGGAYTRLPGEQARVLP